MVIWKFPLFLTHSQSVAMPKDARILSVQFQNDQLALWALVDRHARETRRLIVIHGTGNKLGYGENNATHIATVQQGEFVWHIFDGGELN